MDTVGFILPVPMDLVNEVRTLEDFLLWVNGKVQLCSNRWPIYMTFASFKQLALLNPTYVELGEPYTRRCPETEEDCRDGVTLDGAQREWFYQTYAPDAASALVVSKTNGPIESAIRTICLMERISYDELVAWGEWFVEWYDRNVIHSEWRPQRFSFNEERT